MTTAQPTLVEETYAIPDARTTDVLLSHLPPDAELESPPVTAEFVNSLKKFGQLQEIALGVKEGGDGFVPHVIAGRRRIKGCRAAGFTTIRARLFDPGWEPYEREIALIENGQRSPNFLTALTMVQSYLSEGIGPEGIYERTGMDKALISHFVGLLGMRPRLIKAVLEHKMPRTAAEAAYKLNPEQQDRLIERLDKHGKIMGDDVREVKEARRRKALKEMPNQTGMVEFGVARNGWEPKAVMTVERLLAIIPDDDPGSIVLRGELRHFLDEHS